MPIGVPLANLRCYVLDEHLQLQPVGVPGELMVSGIQVARGYIKRPDLTAEKFIANPFAGGDALHACMYRTGAPHAPPLRPVGGGVRACRLSPGLLRAVRATGDLVRWLPDGNLEFLGRLDHQVGPGMGAPLPLHAEARSHGRPPLSGLAARRSSCWACASSSGRSSSRSRRRPAWSWRWPSC